MESLSSHITNLNKVAVLLDLQMIEKYIKQANQIDSENLETSQLLQSKSYLKIIGIPYLLEKTYVVATTSHKDQ